MPELQSAEQAQTLIKNVAALWTGLGGATLVNSFISSYVTLPQCFMIPNQAINATFSWSN